MYTKQHNKSSENLPLIQHISESSVGLTVKETVITFTVTHIPGANKHGDHVRFTQLRVPGFHQLEELAEGITFLQEMRVTQ